MHARCFQGGGGGGGGGLSSPGEGECLPVLLMTGTINNNLTGNRSHCRLAPSVISTVTGDFIDVTIHLPLWWHLIYQQYVLIARPIPMVEISDACLLYSHSLIICSLCCLHLHKISKLSQFVLKQIVILLCLASCQ